VFCEQITYFVLGKVIFEHLYCDMFIVYYLLFIVSVIVLLCLLRN